MLKKWLAKQSVPTSRSMHQMDAPQDGGLQRRARFEWNALRTRITKMVDVVTVSTEFSVIKRRQSKPLSHCDRFRLTYLQVTHSGSSMTGYFHSTIQNGITDSPHPIAKIIGFQDAL
jgi:hypothetical protein